MQKEGMNKLQVLIVTLFCAGAGMYMSCTCHVVYCYRFITMYLYVICACMSRPLRFLLLVLSSAIVPESSHWHISKLYKTSNLQLPSAISVSIKEWHTHTWLIPILDSYPYLTDSVLKEIYYTDKKYNYTNAISHRPNTTTMWYSFNPHTCASVIFGIFYLRVSDHPLVSYYLVY